MNLVDDPHSEPIPFEQGPEIKTLGATRLPHTLAAWIEARTGLVSVSVRGLTWQVPAYVEGNILYALGGLTFASILIQFFTGVSLVFYYAPAVADAYNSVDYVTYQLPLGWLVRGLHHYNASALIVLAFLHLLRTFFYSAYKRPRELTWLSGVFLLLTTLAFGFTGYLLPWDQKGYWATVVGTEIAAQAPGLGAITSQVMKGGELVGQLTLSRFFVAHTMLLPTLLALLLLFHLQQVGRHGISPTIERRRRQVHHMVTHLYPNWLALIALLAVGLLALLVYVSWQQRVPLAFPADPGSTNFDPRPEWYFLFLYQLLRYVPPSLEPWLVVGVPGIVVGSMVLLPWLDRGEERRPWRKPVTTAIAIFYIVVIVVFTLLAL